MHDSRVIVAAVPEGLAAQPTCAKRARAASPRPKRCLAFAKSTGIQARQPHTAHTRLRSASPLSCKVGIPAVAG